MPKRASPILLNHYQARLLDALTTLSTVQLEASRNISTARDDLLRVLVAANDAGIGYDRLARMTGWGKWKVQRAIKQARGERGEGDAA